jgi:hypothetical protein
MLIHGAQSCQMMMPHSNMPAAWFDGYRSAVDMMILD